MSNSFDVVVIGAGPGGQVAAIRAAQLGLSTACIDEWKNSSGGPAPGGTCTNVGCIPSKALLQSSEHFEQASTHFGDHGIRVGSLEIDLAQMLKRKNSVVKQNNDGILYLFRKNKITFFHGRGTFVGRSGDKYRIGVKGEAEEEIVAQNVIIATGSTARGLPQASFNEEDILSNDGALRMPAVPRRLGVIGSGVVGLELGSVWRRLGSQVTILETLPTFLADADEAIAKEAKKQFDRQGLDIRLGVTVGDVTRGEKGLSTAIAGANGQKEVLEFDKLIVSIGRIPNTAGLGAEAVDLLLDKRGGVQVDDDCRSSLRNVWAIGDVVRGPMLAHKAEDEGVAVAERIAGQKPEVKFNTIPWVIYTYPELAWVGKTEQELRAEGRGYKAGVFPFLANGRARAMGQTTGFAKVIADKATDQVLGVHVIGPMASELIAEGVMAMEFGATSEDIALICHAHPTLSEAMKEASLAVHGRSLNF